MPDSFITQELNKVIIQAPTVIIKAAKSLSQCNHNEQPLRLDMRMPYISISYNLQWGRQKRGSNKLIKADANVDHSTTGGR